MAQCLNKWNPVLGERNDVDSALPKN